MKKLLSLLLILLLALSWVGFAEGDAPEPEQYECGDYTYALLEDGSAEIVKYNGSALVLVIPAELDGHAVSSIGDKAFIFAGLTSITLPDSLTTLDDYAFSDCSSLTAVSIPDNLTSISRNAFDGCDRLTLTVPRDSYAKQYCDEHGLRYIYPDSNDWLND